ncbi:MAG: hypothetical protein JRI68_22115 [Deltaproteobacteria bacterium]|nr:hypothetical protein [Deltaproteobacteria bacterium]
MTMLRRLSLTVVLLAGLACGGDVTVGDGSSDDGSGAAGGMAAGGGAPDPNCTMCGIQSCGLCAQTTGANFIYACRGSGPPPTDKACYQSGSVFHDEVGPYVCWNCD